MPASQLRGNELSSEPNVCGGIMVDIRKSEQAQAFLDLLREYEIYFAKDRGADARELAAQQRALWGAIYVNCKGLLEDENDQIGQAVRFLFAEIDGVFERDKPSILPDQEIRVRSPLPLLQVQKMSGLYPFLQTEPFFIFAAIIVETSDTLWVTGEAQLRLAQSSLTRALSDPRLATELANVVSFRMIQGIADQAHEALQTINSSGDAITSKMNEALADFGRAKDAELEVVARSFEARKNQFDAFLKNAADSIEAARKQATEAGVLLQATRLWARKAILHGLGFWFGLAVMTGVICTCLYLAYWHAPAFLASLPKKPDGEVTYVTVALLTICAIAAGWLLRFIGRFVAANMVLQTDADQRRVMLQTYLALVGDKDAKMEQADRTLILNAVFRPLPGHQSEDVAPPTLLDLAANAVKGKDK